MAFDAPVPISLFDGSKLIWYGTVRYGMVWYGGSGEASRVSGGPRRGRCGLGAEAAGALSISSRLGYAILEYARLGCVAPCCVAATDPAARAVSACKCVET
jgi:hypothetical protein